MIGFLSLNHPKACFTYDDLQSSITWYCKWRFSIMRISNDAFLSRRLSIIIISSGGFMDAAETRISLASLGMQFASTAELLMLPSMGNNCKCHSVHFFQGQITWTTTEKRPFFLNGKNQLDTKFQNHLKLTHLNFLDKIGTNLIMVHLGPF